MVKEWEKALTKVRIREAAEFLTKRSDPVNKPAHYTRGKIEVLDFITDQELCFIKGNIVKYVVRAGYKDDAAELQDLEKAQFYLNRLVADKKRLKDEGDD